MATPNSINFNGSRGANGDRETLKNHSRTTLFELKAERSPLSRKSHCTMMTAAQLRHLPWEDYHPGDTVALNQSDGELHSTRLDFKNHPA